jgi:hypothetical protein
MRTHTPPLAPKLTDNVTIHIVLRILASLVALFSKLMK